MVCMHSHTLPQQRTGLPTKVCLTSFCLVVVRSAALEIICTFI